MVTRFQSKEEALAASKWLLVDAADQPVGRVASQVAALIRGKHKTTFTKHVSGGDFVIVINASKIRFTGKKLEQKSYFSHSGYIGGIKEIPAAVQMEKHPERVIETAVKGMLPRGALGHQMISKLKVYPGTEHPHASQKPQAYKLPYQKA